MSVYGGVAAVAAARSASTPERDRAGYAAVFTAHRAAVIGLAYVLTGDRHVAEDVAAEAFARVWPHWRSGKVEDELTYLRRAVVNEVRSRWRRRAVERREEERRRAVGEVVVGSAADRGAEHDVVVRAMALLRPVDRAVVALRFLEDLSEADTAALLGLRVGTVKSRTSRALARLRAAMEEDEA